MLTRMDLLNNILHNVSDVAIMDMDLIIFLPPANSEHCRSLMGPSTWVPGQDNQRTGRR